MNRFLIGIAKYGRDQHARCFEDVARAVYHSLQSLGHEVEYATREAWQSRPGRLIMFGVNNVPDPDRIVATDAIVYNSEQLSALGDPRWQMGCFEQYRQHVVWDYAEVNVARLRDLGIERPVLCPVGYCPSMTKPWSSTKSEEDIDVLFYGSISPRRREVLDALTNVGIRVAHLFGVYGDERDAVIARSKIVLNLHHYERSIFEIFRVSHLLANRKCVVSEDRGEDPALEALADATTWYVPRSGIVDACRYLLDHEEVRREVAERGFRAFCRTSMVDNVSRALEESQALAGGIA